MHMDNYAITCGNLVKPAAPITLADLFDIVSHNESLSPRARRDICAAIRKIAMLIAPDGMNLPVQAALISKALQGISPAMTGLQRDSYSNIKSRFRRALKMAGVDVHPGKQTNELSQEWQALRNMLDYPRRWIPLSRLAHHASAVGWKPTDIADAHIEHLLLQLRTNAIHLDPSRAIRETCKSWNGCLDKIKGWPGVRLAIVSNRTPYTRSWDEFDARLRQEVEGHLKRIENPLPFSIIADSGSAPSPFEGWRSRKTRRPIAQRTAKNYKFQLLQYLSALVCTGLPLDQLTDLSVATRPDLVERGLTFFYERAGKQMAVQVAGIGQLLVQISKNWLQDSERAAQISMMLSSVPKRKGMSKKVEGLLRQFDDPRNQHDLLGLPRRLANEARKRRDSSPVKAARLFETALAIEMLLMCPVRVGNLATLHIDKHFVRSRPGKEGAVHLVIPAEQVKNRQQIEFELPKPLLNLLHEHLERFRTKLPGYDSRWLFPRTGGKHVATKILGRQLSIAIFHHIGIRMTVHMFRHFGAETFIELQPAGHEVMRQTLGHSSVDTTTRFYARRNPVKAGRFFAEEILKLRDSGYAGHRHKGKHK